MTSPIKTFKESRLTNIIRENKIYSGLTRLIFSFFVEDLPTYKLVQINGVDLYYKDTTREQKFYNFTNNPAFTSTKVIKDDVNNFFGNGTFYFDKLGLNGSGTPYIHMREKMYHSINTLSPGQYKIPYGQDTVGNGYEYYNKDFVGYCLYTDINSSGGITTYNGETDYTRLGSTINLKFQYGDDTKGFGGVSLKTAPPTLYFCSLVGITNNGTQIKYPASTGGTNPISWKKITVTG